MRTFLLLLAAVAGVTSCQQRSGETATQAADTVSIADTVPASEAQPQCFIQVTGKDTARLELAFSGDSVHGRLEYRRYEKDSNRGSISGTRQGNIINVQYSFMSEGVTSTRQAVFKTEGDKVYEGRAKEFDKEGRPVFGEDLEKVEFDSVGFVRGECW
jgi:uncharacterized protein (DUF2147 family)